MKKRIIFLVLSFVLMFVFVAGCNSESGGKDDPVKTIEYTKYDTSTISAVDNSESLTGYNRNLYYYNEWRYFDETGGNGFPDMGDPMIWYADGYYYASGTRGTDRFHLFRSENLSEWHRIADMFVPKAASWSRDSLWAPDVQKIGDKWYLYYTARLYKNGEHHCQIGVAISDTPYGPFKQYEGVNANGETITLGTPAFHIPGATILDQTVFQDDDGELYMYFSYDAKTQDELGLNMQGRAKDTAVAEIWGVKMKDPVTWDLSTLTPLVCPGYQKLSDPDGVRKIEWEVWSPSWSSDIECTEGPYMIKHGGKYFLTYCANSYVDKEYSVGYAMCDTPLGEFVKPKDTYLQNMLLGVPGNTGTYISNRYIGFQTGTGHASIFKTGDGNDYMFAYHAHYNRDNWGKGEKGEWRNLSIDYLYFDEATGLPYTNGPTYSLQRTPSDVSGYSNIIGSAKVTAEGENANYLTDMFTNRAYNTAEVTRETSFTKGTRSIEIKFDSPKTIKAINVYNSYDYSKMVLCIDQIDFGSNRGLVNIMFNQNYINEDLRFIYPHSAFNVELAEELVTDRIVITISSHNDFALGEIEVMGK